LAWRCHGMGLIDARLEMLPWRGVGWNNSTMSARIELFHDARLIITRNFQRVGNPRTSTDSGFA